jgi:hypothetical protein
MSPRTSIPRENIMSKKEVIVADWKKALGKQIAVAQAQTPETSGIPHISLKHGRMTLNDTALPGDEVQCIILASALERTWYDRPYDPEDTGPPECFSLGDKMAGLVPHENVATPPSNACKACPMAEFGTARQGKGPACKTKLRLCLMPVSSVPTVAQISDENAEMAILKVSPTSVVNFNGLGGAGKPVGYEVGLANQGVTPWAVISKVMVRPHNKKMHEVSFSLIKPLGDDDLLAAAYNKSALAEEAVLSPYTYEAHDEAHEANKAAEAEINSASVDGAKY